MDTVNTHPVIKFGEGAPSVTDIGMFWCEPCSSVHAIKVGVGGWTYNNDPIRPTFQPSVLVNPYPGWQVRCHSFVTDGKIAYLDDCEHDKAGQTLELLPIVDWPT